MAGESLYEMSIETGHGFLYLPHAAIFHIPFALLSYLTQWPQSGDVVWRVCSWICFAIACRQLIGASGLDPSRSQWRMAFVVSLLSISALRIGQSTLLMTALMMMSVLAWQKKHWDRSTIFIVLAIAVKPLALVVGLLLFGVSQPMRYRLPIGLVALAAAPFLFQSPGYVWQQYADCARMLGSANSLGNDLSWAQLFGMLNVFGMPIESSTQTLVRLVMAVVTLGVVSLTTNRLVRQSGTWLFAWAAVYLMLFNPRTENSTYCLIAPIVAWLMIRFVVQVRQPFFGWTILGLAVLMTGSYEIGKHFTPDGFNAIWLAPLSCCFFAVFLSWQWWKEMDQPASGSAPALSQSPNERTLGLSAANDDR